MVKKMIGKDFCELSYMKLRSIIMLYKLNIIVEVSVVVRTNKEYFALH